MRAARHWRPVRWARDHRLVVDAAIAGGTAAAATIIHFVQDPNSHAYRDPTWWSPILVIAACVPLVWRRSRPVAAVLAALAAQLVCDVANLNGPGWIPVVVTVYTLGAYASGRARTQAAGAVAVVSAAFLSYALAIGVERVSIGIVIWLLTVLTICFLAGDIVQRRRTELADLAARAERAELERELLAGQRVAEERTRIARDLHDVVAHSVSVIVIQASAARRNIGRDPAAAAELLDNIEATGRQTMGELRQILGVLRDPASDAPTTPVLSDIDSLVRSTPGLDVHVTTTGSIDDIPTGVALSAFRVVQEALTNTQRHAGPHVVVDVVVDCNPERVSVTVSDNGRGASTQARTNGGYGLIGMGERVAAFGGSLRTGPRRSGGWQVRAQFPLDSGKLSA